MARICTKADTYPDGRAWVGHGIQPTVKAAPTVAEGRVERETERAEVPITHLICRRLIDRSDLLDGLGLVGDVEWLDGDADRAGGLGVHASLTPPRRGGARTGPTIAPRPRAVETGYGAALGWTP